MKTVSQVSVQTPVLRLTDSYGRAAEALRAAGISMLPVTQDGHLVGMLHSDELLDAIARHPEEDASARSIADLTLERAIVLPPDMNAARALFIFQDQRIRAAPVVDYDGRVLGIVGSAQLASAVCGRVRPPMIGGMATPVGVYLTCGVARGGVGDLALFCSGIFLGLLHTVSVAAAYWLVAESGWLPWSESWPALYGSALFVLFSLLFYGLLLRFSWVAGYHAAEHQVVHAVERCSELTPEEVSEMPRVHPRCGTNLVAAILLMTVGTELIQLLQEMWRRDLGGVMLPMVATFLFWRRVGGWLQQNVTTRRASLRQIRSGISAAEELMQEYQKAPSIHGRRLVRMWNMGLIQVASGVMLVIALLSLLQRSSLPLPEALRQVAL